MGMSKHQRDSIVRRTRGMIWSTLRLLLLGGLVFIILSPLIYYLANAFKSYTDMYDVTVKYIPREPTLNNFKMLTKFIDYPVTMLKTTGFVALIALLQTASCCLVGYGFGRFNFVGSKILFALVMVTLVVPPQIILLPMYVRFRNFNLLELFKFSGVLSGTSIINTPLPILLLAITALGFKSGLYIFLFRQFFRNIPVSLEEAAALDGCGSFKTFFHIMLPNATTMILTVFLFSFVLQWNDYYYTTMLMPDVENLSMRIVDAAEYYRSINSLEMVERLYYPSYIVLIGPLVILYAFTQRFFVQSVTRSGITGE